MPVVDIYDWNKQVVGSLELADAVFAANVNDALLYEAVRHEMASRRRGTAKTKHRWEVAGSGKKLWRQKGTGRARMGSIRSPLWRHGGTVHGPVPRDYSYHLPKKMLLGALRSALTAKLRDGELAVVRDLTLADHKTKTMRKALTGIEAKKTVLLVDVWKDDEEKRNLILGTQNLEGVTLVPSRELTTYEILRHAQVLLSEAAAKRLSEGLA